MSTRTYTTGIQIDSTAEFANLPAGTLMVATKGTHIGTSYRIHVGFDGTEVLGTDAYGNSQSYSLQSTVEADYDMRSHGVTVVWMPIL